MKLKNQLKSVLVVTMVVLITISLPAFAKTPKQPTGIPIPQYSPIPEVEYITEDPVTATGEETVNANWSAKVHTNIVREGIAKVKKDYPNLASRLTTSFTPPAPYATTSPEQLLVNGINWPDSGETDNNTWAGHFYDPANECNYQGYFTPTAYTRFNNHYASAVNASSKMSAWLELSYALHYFGDLNNPHHAANVPYALTGDLTHLRFESFADTNYSNFTTSWKTDAFVANSTMKSIANYYAENAKAYIAQAKSDSDTDKRTAINNTLPYAQSGAAGMIYKFLLQTSW